MLHSNTNIPEVDNAPSWYPCQPMPGLYTTGLYIHVYRSLGCIWLVSVAFPDCVCLPPFSLRGWGLGMRLGGMDLLGTSSFKGASLLFLWYNQDQQSCCGEYSQCWPHVHTRRCQHHYTLVFGRMFVSWTNILTGPQFPWLIGLHVYHCVHEHQCAVMLTFPCTEVNTESAHHNTHSTVSCPKWMRWIP